MKFSKREVAFDRHGRKWIRFSDNCKKPPYEIPPTAIYDIGQLTIDHLIKEFDAVEIYCCAIPLPFYSTPMWLSKKSYIENACDFAYCVCLSCGEFIGAACRLALNLILSQNEAGTLYFSCRIQVMCAQCSPHQLYDCTYYPTVISAEASVRGELKRGWDEFMKEQNFKKCGVCSRKVQSSGTLLDEVIVCCSECAYALSLMSQWQNLTPRQFTHQHPREIMTSILQTFYQKKIDPVSALVKKICYGQNCRNILQAGANAVHCTYECRRVVYCSKRCRKRDKDRHFCMAMESIWKLSNVVSLLTWTQSSEEKSDENSEIY